MRNGEKIIITDSVIASEASQSSPQKSGTITSINKQEGSFNIQTQDGELVIKKLKAQGKSELSAVSWLNGCRLQVGDLVEN